MYFIADIGLKPNDPRWIGAWWLGFVIFGIGSLIFSIPIFFFPRNFRKQTIEYHDNEGLMCKLKGLYCYSIYHHVHLWISTFAVRHVVAIIEMVIEFYESIESESSKRIRIERYSYPN